MEDQLLYSFANQLAMCELLSIHSLLEPSLAHTCKAVENFVKIDYFNNNYNDFVKWWDASVVPLISEFQHIMQNSDVRNKSSS